MARAHKAPLVCVLAYDGLATFEFGIAVEVFGVPRPEFDPWYRFLVVSADGQPLKATGGITVTASGTLRDLRDAALVIIPGCPHPDATFPQELVEALRDAHRRGTRIASICTGAFALAQAGLLDGRRATTHWRHAEKLAARYPRVEVLPDILYIDEGDVLTSAGASAGLDLCLHIVRRDFGVARANDVARRLVMPAHRTGGQAQFIQRPVARDTKNSIGELLDQLRQRLDEEWTIERVAQLVHVSRRTLLRRFRLATGESPLSWLTAERVERAKELLETPTIQLKEVAAAAGFRSPETFRHHFRQRVGISPSEYRASFGDARQVRASRVNSIISGFGATHALTPAISRIARRRGNAGTRTARRRAPKSHVAAEERRKNPRRASRPPARLRTPRSPLPR
jgi:AraC family transcriptional activator FtrA